jgi:hypothetical protein
MAANDSQRQCTMTVSAWAIRTAKMMRSPGLVRTTDASQWVSRRRVRRAPRCIGLKWAPLLGPNVASFSPGVHRDAARDVELVVPRVRSRCRFKKRGTRSLLKGTESLMYSESGVKWMSGGAKRQCGRALAAPPRRSLAFSWNAPGEGGAVILGLGRIIALRHRPSSSYQMHSHKYSMPLFLKRQCERTPAHSRLRSAVIRWDSP